MQEFVDHSAASGILLLAATIVALVLANSPLSDAYTAVLKTPIGLTVGPFAISDTLQHWVNDGLMAIFFLLVGLEIKREVLVGELSEPRVALLPAAAAIGGVVAPALIYLAFNRSPESLAGWAVPTATDIAFALGVLALLGDRVPLGLKVALTAIAIVDDLIAVLVIALFYSGGIQTTPLLIGFGILGLMLLVNVTGVRSLIVYGGLGLLVWLAFLQSGVHATVAGVLVALTIPARSRIDAPRFATAARSILERFDPRPDAPASMLTDENQQAVVQRLESLCEAVQAPLQRMEHSVHGVALFVIMPIFALANAGVTLSPAALGGEGSWIALGTAAALIIGKPLGLIGMIWLVVRLGWASLPAGVSWRQVIGLGLLAGIGFTMSLFIASLGFEDQPARLEAAKLGILAASTVAGVVGYLWLRRASTTEASPSS
jgi:NhaA family Na+:H+ antiporter